LYCQIAENQTMVRESWDGRAPEEIAYKMVFADEGGEEVDASASPGGTGGEDGVLRRVGERIEVGFAEHV
jgi:hypothetical protein